MKTKISSKKFDTYKEMSGSAKNWDHHCSYTLLPHAFEGEHHVIELPDVQLSYSYREGGFMHDAIAPPNCISIAVIQSCGDKACFDTFKLQKGMVLFFDDSKSFNFMSKGEITVAIISIPKSLSKESSLDLEKNFGKFIEDDRSVFSNLFDKILKNFLNDGLTLNLEEAQQELITALQLLLKTQTVQEPKLTKGERIALAIRDQVYHHMDGKINIESFAKQYQVSDQTLINAFKSLFGFTPKHFLLLLKLNLVHNELKNSDPETCTVLRIASKWGFSHMGRFSKDYTQLFGENPSLTLKRAHIKEKNMTSECASRQDELEI